jgi:DNA-binding NarL/FixJ family response regulator
VRENPALPVAEVQFAAGERLLAEAVAGALRDLTGPAATVDLVDRALLAPPVGSRESTSQTQAVRVVIDLDDVDISVSLTGMSGRRCVSTRVGSLGELVRLARSGAGAPSLPVEPERRRTPPGDRLTNRELEVLAGMRRGETNQAIASALGISVHTVRGYVGSIMRKLGANSRVEAMTRSS